MNGFCAPLDGDARLVLAFAIALASYLPIWALLLWIAASSLPWRWKAERSRKSLLLPVAMLAFVVGGTYVWTRGTMPFISESRMAERQVVFWVAMVELFLGVIALIVVAWARDQAGVGTEASAHRKLRRGRALVLAWGVLAVVLAALRAGPLGGKSTPSVFWWALAASSGVLVTLMVLLIIAIADLRKGGTSSGGVAARSGG